MFKVGEKVISKITNTSPNAQKREKYRVYKVNATIECEGCNRQKINIGQRGEPGLTGCDTCGWTQEDGGLYWTASKYFMKFTENNVKAAIEDCIEEENYELAAYLRDQFYKLEEV